VRRYGPLAILLAALPLLAFGPDVGRSTPTHWALIIGVGKYQNFPKDQPGGYLPGAENDARNYRDLLVGKYGFPQDHIKLLLSEQATRAAIRDGIKNWLVTNARPEDNVVIFFAGHGSQVWDGPPTPDHPHVIDGDEDDGLDETLAPTDALAASDKNDIIDDEFNNWLSQLPTSDVVVVLDNCNSGTGTRSVTPFSRARRLGRDVNALPKPASVARRAIPDKDDKTGFEVKQAKVLELSAAQPNQAAVDAYFPAQDGAAAFHGGAFTTYLVRQMWRAPAGETYEDVFKQVAEALKQNRFEQEPYLSEDVNLKNSSLFAVVGGKSEVSDASLPVQSVTGGEAVLAGGLPLGITAGSVFETPGGAHLVVDSVAQESSTAKVASGSVKAGERARLVGYRYTVAPLLVNISGIDTGSANALKQALKGNASVRLVDQEDAYSQLLVRRRGTILRVIGADGFLRHDSIPSGAAGAKSLASILRQEAAAKGLGEMDNPAPPFGVQISTASGKASFGLGENVVFKATADRDGYLTLVDLGTDGTVTMLLPNQYTPPMKVTAGQTITFPTPNSQVELEMLPPTGRGLVRAFVTPEPLGITIPSGKDFAEGDESFARQIGEAVKKAAGQVDGAVRLDNWATASLVYQIHG
jgi:Caspase domain/Domain of unknown function (DUF4384)